MSVKNENEVKTLNCPNCSMTVSEEEMYFGEDDDELWVCPQCGMEFYEEEA